MADLKVTVGADASEYNKVIAGLGDTAKKGTDDAVKNIDGANKNISSSTKKMADDVDKGGNNAGNSFKQLGKVIASAVVIDKIIDLGKQMLDITAKFEKYDAVLTNTLGSQEAAAATLKTLQSFAAATPFSVDELTASYIKLANQGFLPTRGELTKLGDLASSTGKNFDQLTEAILDAQVGEFERLKEFGIRAQDNGDKITFTFKGVQTQVDKTAQSIRDYITSLGDAEGVSGSMEAISKTLTGQLSNLGDSWDAVLVSFGNRTSGVFKEAISHINDFFNRVTQVNNNIENAAKVGEGKGFFSDYLDRVKSLFTGRQTSTDIIGNDVEFRNQQYAEIANKAIESAKSAEDFQKATKLLTDSYQQEAKRLQGSPSLLASLKLGYDNAVALVRAQQKAFEQNKNANGNFGKKTGAKPKEGFAINEAEIKENDKNIEIALRSGNTALAEQLQNRNRILENELKRLKDNFDDLSMVAGRSDLKSFTPLSISGESGKGYGIGNSSKGMIDPQSYENLDGLDKWRKAAKAKIEDTEASENAEKAYAKLQTRAEAVANVFGNGLTSSFQAALSGTQSFLSAFGQFLMQMIEQMAAAALAALALSAVLAIFTGGSSLLAGAGASTSFGTLFSSFSGLPKFAEGGIVSQPTLGVFGEAGTEAVMPIEKLQNFVSNNGGGGNYQPAAQVIGGDLLITWMKQAEKSNKRRT